MENKLVIRISGNFVEIWDLNSPPAEFNPGDLFLRFGEKKKFILGSRSFVSYCGATLKKIGENTVEVSFFGDEEEIFSRYSPLDQNILQLAKSYGTPAILDALKRNRIGGNFSISQEEKAVGEGRIFQSKKASPGLLTGLFNPRTGNQYSVIKSGDKFFPVETLKDSYPVTFFHGGTPQIYVSFSSYSDCIIFLKDQIFQNVLPEYREKVEILDEKKAVGKSRVRKIK